MLWDFSLLLRPFETEAAMTSMKNLFASEQVNYKYDLKERDIILHPDQGSALVVEQGDFHKISEKSQIGCQPLAIY